MVSTAYTHIKHVIDDSPYINNLVFKLCYRWTVFVLIAFSFVVTCKLLIGNSFNCAIDGDFYPVHYTDFRCYTKGVYISPAELAIQSYTSPLDDSSEQEFKRYQSHYPWVNLFFLVQAFIIYAPHVLWQTYEGGYVRRLTAGIQTSFDKTEKQDLELCYLSKYVLRTRGKHNLYMALCVFFEALNLSISTYYNVWLVDFFNVTGVPNFLPLTIETWSDFQNFYFPSEAKCDLHRFDTVGMSIYFTAKCELPLNDTYMNMFRFLQAWYGVLAILCGLVLIYRFAFVVPFVRAVLIAHTTPLVEPSVQNSLFNRMSFTDWFFLRRLQKVMRETDFAEMLKMLATASKEKDEREKDKNVHVIEEPMKDFAASEATSPL